MVRTLVSMFDDVSTRELSQRRLDLQTTAFGLMLGQVEVPGGLSSEFSELEQELKRREAAFNQHRVTVPIASLLGELLLAIELSTLEEMALHLAFGYERKESQQCKLNPKNLFFDEIELTIGERDKVEKVTFHLRLDLRLDELQAFVSDLAETERNSASRTFSILRMHGNHCGKLDFVMHLNGNDLRLDQVVVTQLR